MALVKLTAPILPHTADELWSHLSFVEEPSVQLTDMPEGVLVPQAEATEAKFDRFMEVRDDVLKALEIARNEKVIGRSLEASVTLYATDEVKNLIASIKEDVKQLFIISELTVEDEQHADASAPEYTSGRIVVQKQKENYASVPALFQKTLVQIRNTQHCR